MIHTLRSFRRLNLISSFEFSASMAENQWGLVDDYQILAPLGKGSSARVFMGVNVLTNERVVIKTFKQIPPQAIRKQISVNLYLLSKLTSNNKHVEFIKLLDVCFEQASKAYTFIYEFFPGVPLNQLIQKVSLTQAKRYALILAHTLKYVHNLGIIHRDMKPGNILITPLGPKLFDFGLARTLQDNFALKTNNFGTKCYKSPQVILRMATYNPFVDIWGLGIILAEMALNKKHLLPFQNDRAMLSQICSLCNLKQQDKSLFSRQYLPHIFIDKNRSWEALASKQKLDPQLIELVKRMLQINPAKRPTLDEIIGHSTFKQIILD